MTSEERKRVKKHMLNQGFDVDDLIEGLVQVRKALYGTPYEKSINDAIRICDEILLSQGV